VPFCIEERTMAQNSKITTGPNDRPRNETIGQSGAGLPDDTGRPVDVDDAEVDRVRKALLGNAPQAGNDGGANTDEVPPGTPGSGENICRRCAGTGRLGAEACPDCGGTGKVVTPVGGAG
jgi:hypothetical protein